MKIVDPQGREADSSEVFAGIAASRVVFIGETHDRYDEHVSQLEVIRALHAMAPGRWTIGVEYFQRRFQPVLDAFIRGSITERDFLLQTEYFDRWGFDFRLYRSIFSYAREQGIPVVALSAERELTERVGQVGLAGLSTAERAQLPREIDKSDEAYRSRLRSVFDEHSNAKDFDHFQEVQLTWDETMAETAAEYLATHSGKNMIVLAGSEHIAFGSGIPNRVRRRLPGISTVMLQAGDAASDAKGADYVLLSKNIELPPAGRMGIVMDQIGGITAREVTAGGAAAQAGIQPKDRIVAINDAPVQSVSDVRIALLDKRPGDRVSLRVQTAAEQERTLELTLK